MHDKAGCMPLMTAESTRAPACFIVVNVCGHTPLAGTAFAYYSSLAMMVWLLKTLAQELCCLETFPITNCWLLACIVLLWSSHVVYTDNNIPVVFLELPWYYKRRKTDQCLLCGVKPSKGTTMGAMSNIYTYATGFEILKCHTVASYS